MRRFAVNSSKKPIRKFRHMKMSCEFCVSREQCMHCNYPLCTNDAKFQQFDAHAFEMYNHPCPNDLKEKLSKR